MRSILLGLVLLTSLPAWAAESPAAPNLTAISPLSGAPGTSFEAVIRGKNLGKATGLWSPDSEITGEVLSVEPGEKKDPDLLRVRLQFDTALSDGLHDLRVITAGGLSNAVTLLAHRQPPVLEADGSRDTAVTAQKLASWPVAVQGSIDEVGQVDFYSFEVEAGQELLFRTHSSAALDPGLSVWQLTGSWFDPGRPTRLAFVDEASTYPGAPVEAMLRYRFEEAGEYLIRVNGFWGYGGDGQSYTLLIDEAPDGEVEWPLPQPAPLWKERSWTRPIDEDRMARLAGRSVLDAEPPALVVLDADAEPTKFPVEPPQISGPTLVTGTIERPGDIDTVRFSVEEGDKLSFEIETPEKTIPLLNPLLRVFDADGGEALTNIWTRVNSNGNTSKQIYPKTQYAFPRKGDFTLEIRDITASYGGPEMQYKVLIRPWVPHLGEARVSKEHVNLVAGRAQELSITIDQEEGFEGLAIFSIEGLPAGVEAVMGAEVDPDTQPMLNPGKIERFTSKKQKATFVLLSAEDTPLTETPVAARIYARPAVDGKLGRRILAKEVLMMVVADVPADTETTVLTDTR